MQYSITLHRPLFVQGWCDVLEQDRTVESSTPYGTGMLSLRNGLLQKSAFLRHNRCIELGKRYIKALASARVKQPSPGIFLSRIFLSCRVPTFRGQKVVKHGGRRGISFLFID